MMQKHEIPTEYFENSSCSAATWKTAKYYEENEIQDRRIISDLKWNKLAHNSFQ